MQFRHECPWKRSSASCKEKKRQRLSSPPSVLSGADENWQRSFREGRQWARIVKTSLPNHGGREQRQSPPLLRGHKLIRRRKGAPQVFSPRNAARRLSLGSRARTKSPDVISLCRGGHHTSWSCLESNLIRIETWFACTLNKSYFAKLKNIEEKDIPTKKIIHHFYINRALGKKYLFL